MHKLLQRQIKRHFGAAPLPDSVCRLVDAIDQTYRLNDEDRALLERSLELSSEELNERYNDLKNQLEVNRKAAASLELARRVFEVSLDGIVIVDPDFRVVDINDALCQMLGKPAHKLLGRSLAKAAGGDWEKVFEGTFGKQVSLSREWTGEIRTPDAPRNPSRVLLVAFSVVCDSTGSISNYVGTFSDITQLKKAEDQLQQLAYYDPLTGLPNRRMFKENIENIVESTGGFRNKIALLYVDLDRFKFVNDTLGHAAGDQLLIKVAERIRLEIRGGDSVSRQGGDEFSVALFGIDNDDIVREVASRIVTALRKPFTIDSQPVYIGASIGICMLPEQALSFEDAVRKADTAMYLAKTSNSDESFRFWDEHTQQEMESRVRIEADLREAVGDGQLVAHYQPIFCAASRRIVSFEALMRWHHPGGALVMPDAFIPIAEEAGIIGDLENWMIARVCDDLRAWQQAGCDLLPVSINLSARHLAEKNLRQVFRTALGDTIDPRLITIEVTESTAMSEPEETVRVLDGLREDGIETVIDDFGTGYSSLSHLKQLPVIALKIDRSFVRDLDTDADDRGIARAVVELGHSLSLLVTAEGVETEDQLAYLQSIGCDHVQGWLFAKAMPAADAAAYLTPQPGSASASRAS